LTARRERVLPEQLSGLDVERPDLVVELRLSRRYRGRLSGVFGS
jgi:hypothetical protein